MGDRTQFVLKAVGSDKGDGSSGAAAGVVVGPAGVNVGRDALQCGLVIPDTPANRMVGRRQAFLVPHQGSLHLINLGQNPTYVNGGAVVGTAELGHGAVLQFEESPVAITVSSSGVEPTTAKRKVAWRLDGKQGQTYGVVRTPFCVGGGARDQVHVEGWSEAVLRFHLAQDALYLEPQGTILCNGVPLDEAEHRSMNHGDELEVAGRVFVVMAMAAGGPATTVVKARETLPLEVELRFLPRGANLVVTFVDSTANALLSEKQADLAGALLQPRHGVEPGEFIEDQELLDRVWPRDLDKTQKTLNLLVHQLRSKLLQSELDANVLIAKPPRGGATRFTLAPGAKVRVVSS